MQSMPTLQLYASGTLMKLVKLQPSTCSPLFLSATGLSQQTYPQVFVHKPTSHKQPFVIAIAIISIATAIRP